LTVKNNILSDSEMDKNINLTVKNNILSDGEKLIVKIPRAYSSVIERIRDDQPFYTITEAGEYYELKLNTGFAFDRITLNLTEKDLIKLFKVVKVEGGKKRREKNHIIFIPKRPVKATVRFSEEEVAVLKEVAHKKGMPLADYIRFSALEDAFREVDNVMPKCVPSILDVKMDPDKWQKNPYSKLFK